LKLHYFWFKTIGNIGFRPLEHFEQNDDGCVRELNEEFRLSFVLDSKKRKENTFLSEIKTGIAI
jgi:hypothetical protein